MNEILQIAAEDWDEIGVPVAIAVTPYLFGEVEDKFGIRFETYDDDGLGEAKGAFIKAGLIKYFLESHPEGPDVASNITILVRSIEPDTEVALENIVIQLELDRTELLWEAESLGKAKWVLVRLDDNGNEVEMRRFQNEASANWIKMQYESKGHKQTYFVQNAT